MIPRHLIEEITDSEYIEGVLAMHGLEANDIAAEDRPVICQLSELNIFRLKKMIRLLEEVGLLNSETISRALQKVTFKSPAAIQKTANCETPYICLDHDKPIFMHMNAYNDYSMAGREGVVNIGYDHQSLSSPKYRVKRFMMNHEGSDVLATAKREVKFAQLLGQDACWFRSENNFPVVVANWIHGIPLDKLHIDAEKMTYKRGLKWLISELKLINFMHEHGRILGEIKSTNLIVNEHDDTMTSIDYSAARKFDSQKPLPFTIAYMDPGEGEPRRPASDMYALHYVLPNIFKKILATDARMTECFFSSRTCARSSYSMMKPYVKVIDNQALSTIETAIIYLLEALREPNADYRCTSEQALQYCEAIAAATDEADQLTENDLHDILNKTLNRHTFTVEDALRGSKRPAKFVSQPAETERTAGDKSNQSGFKIFNQRSKKKPKVDDSNPTPSFLT